MDETKPKYLIVEKNIRDAIKDWKPDQKLPGERVLAKELGMSYMTIRKAIENLVTDGLLYKIPTKGTFVADGRARKVKSKTIGYFLDSRIIGGLSSPYYSMIFNALEKETAKNGYSLVYFTENDSDKLNKTLKKLDGIIASCFLRIEQFIYEINDSVPVVVIDNSASDKTIPSVIIDNFNAMMEAVDYLCELGHKRIGFMTGLEDSDIGKNRFEGYKTSLLKHGITPENDLIYHGDYSFESGKKGAKYLLELKPQPTAIVSANDSMAMGVMSILQSRDLNVPVDYSLIGFDDIDVACQITPALTTLAAPISQIAAVSFKMLKNLIDGQSPKNMHVALPAKLIIRNTTAEVSSKNVAALSAIY
ncbi:MAG: DNA-binding LacI/PurR family transcriptional regulator [Gammaproteobacteria bacterium]|jgi:DNA-binding LacI/PurR family transcriptional regulator